MFRGVFLNLERNTQRRDTLLQHLAAIGAANRYERWEAVDGRAAKESHATTLDAGNLGLWLSHENLLEARTTPDHHLHILEDDAILARNLVPVLDDLLGLLDQSVPSWDMLFTDVMLTPSTDLFRNILPQMKEFSRSRRYVVWELGPIDFAGTTSFVLKKSSIEKYLDLISGKWALGIPIDLFIRNLVREQKLNACITVPFITSISYDSKSSDIRGQLDRSRMVLDTLRRALFEEADISALHTEMSQYIVGANHSPLLDLYLMAEMFYLSGKAEGI
jgi:GR25 family glycosyltransferase involved in LPS biosynthesis